MMAKDNISVINWLFPNFGEKRLLTSFEQYFFKVIRVERDYLDWIVFILLLEMVAEAILIGQDSISLPFEQIIQII